LRRAISRDAEILGRGIDLQGEAWLRLAIRFITIVLITPTSIDV
jgi:hypothetical protein